MNVLTEIVVGLLAIGHILHRSTIARELREIRAILQPEDAADDRTPTA